MLKERAYIVTARLRAWADLPGSEEQAVRKVENAMRAIRKRAKMSFDSGELLISPRLVIVPSRKRGVFAEFAEGQRIRADMRGTVRVKAKSRWHAERIVRNALLYPWHQRPYKGFLFSPRITMRSKLA